MTTTTTTAGAPLSRTTPPATALGKYLVGTHRYSFRAGEPAEIIAIESFTPPGKSPRDCYRIRFADGTEDHVPISDGQFFAIISADDVAAGRIPPVCH